MSTTRAILLRKRRLSDTSLIVSWCTESLGLVQTVARGARRPKSPFRGLLDLFFEVEIAIAFSRKTNLHTLREVSLLEPFVGIRRSHQRTQVASYFVELLEACNETEHHDPQIFALLRRAFAYLNERDPNRVTILHFESELARIAGVQHGDRAQAARGLTALFGKLPSVRNELLRLLRNDPALEGR